MGSRSVAVISAGLDDTAVAVAEAIRRRRVDALFFDTHRVPAQACLSLGEGAALLDGRSLGACGAAYVKSVSLAIPAADVADVRARPLDRWPHRWAAERERQCMLASVVRWIEHTGATVVNPARAIEWHVLKPLQAEVLQRAKVRVPRSLATNDARAVLAFAERFGELIYKPIAGGATVRSVRRDELTPARLAQLSTAPVLFQERVFGREFRVYVLDDEPVQAFEVPVDGAVDARVNVERAVRARLPRVVWDTCRRAARALGLIFTAVDVRVTPAGEPVVLECNPTPSISFYEPGSKGRIVQALASFLCRHA